MDLDAYFARIGYDGGREPTLQNLRAMHRAHAYTVPFENLDIAAGTRIQIDEDVNFDKIVRRRRGGFCLELTGMFGRALRQLGYSVDVLGARVMMDGRLSHANSHMVLLVHLDEPWIADVGFGGRVIEPLRLHDREPQAVGIRSYVLENDGDHWFNTCLESGYDIGPYIFTLQPRQFDEFHEVCGWLQTSPDSRFTHGNIVSLARPDGRTTLAGGRLIRVDGGERSVVEITPADEPAILKQEFSIVL